MTHKTHARIARLVLLLWCGLTLAFLILPIVAIVPISMNSEPYLQFPTRHPSLRWYEELFSSEAWAQAFRNSLVVATAAAILALTLGTLAALGAAWGRLPGRSLIMALFLSPLLVPHVIIGLGLYFLYAKIGLAASLASLILAHTTLAAPFVVMIVASALSRVSINTLRAAASLGASPTVVFLRVIAPLIAPAIAGGAILAFLTSFDEIDVALMLAGPEQRTVPR